MCMWVRVCQNHQWYFHNAIKSSTNQSRCCFLSTVTTTIIDMLERSWKDFPELVHIFTTLSSAILQDIICKIKKRNTLLFLRWVEQLLPCFNYLPCFLPVGDTPTGQCWSLVNINRMHITVPASRRAKGEEDYESSTYICSIWNSSDS